MADNSVSIRLRVRASLLRRQEQESVTDDSTLSLFIGSPAVQHAERQLRFVAARAVDICLMERAQERANVTSKRQLLAFQRVVDESVNGETGKESASPASLALAERIISERNAAPEPVSAPVPAAALNNSNIPRKNDGGIDGNLLTVDSSVAETAVERVRVWFDNAVVAGSDETKVFKSELEGDDSHLNGTGESASTIQKEHGVSSSSVEEGSGSRQRPRQRQAARTPSLNRTEVAGEADGSSSPSLKELVSFVVELDAPDEIIVHASEKLRSSAFVALVLQDFMQEDSASEDAADAALWSLDADTPFQVSVPRQLRMRVERREKRREQRERRQLRSLREAGAGRVAVPPAVHSEFTQLRAKFHATFWELRPAQDNLESIKRPLDDWVASAPANSSSGSSSDRRSAQDAGASDVAASADADAVAGDLEFGFAAIPQFLPARVRILIVPSDPDFPFDLDAVDLRVNFPVGYPGGMHDGGVVEAERPLFHVANDPDELPPKFCRTIERQLSSRVSTAYAKDGQKNVRPYMQNLMRWLDNRLESMLVDKHDTIDFQAKQLGIEFVGIPEPPRLPTMSTSQPSANGARGSQVATSSANEDSDDGGYEPPAWLALQLQQMKQHDRTTGAIDDSDDTSSGDGTDIAGDESEDANDTKDADSAASKKSNAKKESFATTTAHRGTQFVVEDLMLRNVGIMECTALTIVITCGRCRVQDELRLPAVGQANVPPDGFMPYSCHNCHDERTLAFRAEKMHEMGSIVGYVDIEPAGAVSILEVLDTSTYAVTCLECGEVLEGARGIPLNANRSWQRRCRQCHNAMDVQFGKITQRRVRVERSREDLARIQERIAASAARRKEQRDLLVKDPWMREIRVGNPLPDHGTCRHYKRSKRWLRFPCCRRVFPCDLCHDEGTLPENFHQVVWATRMLCGFCSFEQSFRMDGACDNCGKILGVVHSNHWEGGGGQRDARKLNKGDSRKYAGKNKTQSQKSKRVGQAGKERRDRGAGRGRGRGGRGGGGGGAGATDA